MGTSEWRGKPSYTRLGAERQREGKTASVRTERLGTSPPQHSPAREIKFTLLNNNNNNKRSDIITRTKYIYLKLWKRIANSLERKHSKKKMLLQSRLRYKL